MPPKRKCLSDPLLVPVEMNGIELPEETSFQVFWLDLYSIYGLEAIYTVHCQGCFKGSAQHFLTPESILYLYKSIIWLCMEYCSHIWGGAPKSHRLDLLDRVQKRVVSLVSYGLSSDLPALSHRRNVATLSLFYKYYYGKCS